MFNALKKKDYLIIDNFLDDSVFLDLENVMVNNRDLPLYFIGEVASTHGTTSKDVPWSYAFKHHFYNHDRPESDYFPIIYNTFIPKFDEVLKKYYNTDFKSLVRCKLNFFPYTKTIKEYDQHTDQNYFHYGAVFSLNTCNGFTRIGKDIKIDSIKNRIVFFNSSTPHNSTTTSNCAGRWNINFNFL